MKGGGGVKMRDLKERLNLEYEFERKFHSKKA